MKPLLTVFTPTFNRAYTLYKCYESLKRQTCKAFIWLVIDDGSTDDTSALIEKWQQENIIQIRYYYQENQGMHGAHNTAYRLIDTELNTCIDSDDYMTEDAVEKILTFWGQHKNQKYAGIIALDITKEGDVIGNRLPEDRQSVTLTDYYQKGGKGDKKLIYRSDVIKKYPDYPIFEGEKYVGLNYKYMMIDQDYELLILNEPVCVVEYMPDGSSMNMLHQYKKNPKGFCELRRVMMIYAPNAKVKFRVAIHYVSSSLFSRNKRFISDSPCKIATICAIPLGMLLYLYIQWATCMESS